MFFVAGLYLLVTMYSPAVFKTNRLLARFEPTVSAGDVSVENQIVIPKLNVKVNYYSGDESVLNRGAWNRFPERGNPKDGGNFILAGHRFRMSLTPWSTNKSSPFYNLDKLQDGDEILIRYDGQDYSYRVAKMYEVEPNATEIEDVSAQDKLTLYTCTMGGSSDGRLVVEAHQVR
jgi:sortase A